MVLVLPIGLLVIWRQDAALRRVHLCLLIFVLGAIRYTATLPAFDERSLARLNDAGPVLLEGSVVDPPIVHDRIAEIRLEAARVRVERTWREVAGLALVQVPRETDVRYGDRLQVYGQPATPFESPNFSYKEYLARQGIYTTLRVYGSPTLLARDQGHPFFTALYAFRARALTTVHSLFPEPTASLPRRHSAGDDAGLSREVEEAFRKTNTAHIIAISGFNISLIAGLLAAFARRMSRRRGVLTVFVLVGLATYTLLVGAAPSVVRATLMASLAVLARYWGRESDALNALAFAGLAMLCSTRACCTISAFNSVFLRRWGLLLYVQPITQWATRVLARGLPAPQAPQWAGALSDALIVTLAAQLTTTPLIVFAFHRVSPIALVTNLLILPAQPAVMVLGGLATLGGLVFQPLGQLAAWVAWPFLAWTIGVVQWTASWPIASLPVDGWTHSICCCAMRRCFGATVYGGRLCNRVLGFAAQRPLYRRRRPGCHCPRRCHRTFRLWRAS